MIYAYALKLTRNPANAEDLTSDVVIKAISNQDKFVPGSNLAAWLSTITFNTFAMQTRKQKRILYGDVPERHTDPVGTHRLELEKALEGSGEENILISLHGFSYDEVAQIKDVPLGTIKSRVHRSREKINGVVS
jgi:RNA polymerase sigma-70 factor (ECF subfamily)